MGITCGLGWRGTRDQKLEQHYTTPVFMNTQPSYRHIATDNNDFVRAKALAFAEVKSAVKGGVNHEPP